MTKKDEARRQGKRMARVAANIYRAGVTAGALQERARLAASPASPPAEALPSQTSGAEALGPGHVCEHGIRWPWACDDCDRSALAKPASEPAGGGVREALRKIYDDGVACHDLWFFRELKAIIDALSSPASSSPAEAPKQHRFDPEDGDIIPGEGSDPADYLKPAEAEALPAGVVQKLRAAGALLAEQEAFGGVQLVIAEAIIALSSAPAQEPGQS